MGETYSLNKQIEAAKLLREQMADLCAGDPDFMRDMIEGETSLHECIGVLAAAVREEEAICDGITALIGKLQGRRDQVERRADLKRALIATGMSVAGLKSLDTPAGAVTVKAVPPKALVTEESDIPARFWKSAAPTLDRKALAAALKAREAAITCIDKDLPQEQRAAALEAVDVQLPAIPGATLSNGGETIQIRG